MASLQEEIQTLQKQLDNATDYDERSVLRKKIRELKKSAGQTVGSVRRGDAAYRRPGMGMKGPSNKPIPATSADGGSYIAPKPTAAKVTPTTTPQRAPSPAVDSAKPDAVSPSSSVPSSRKSSQSVESKDSLQRVHGEASREHSASPGHSANGLGDAGDDHPDDERDTPSNIEKQPDVEEADFAPAGEEEESVPPPTESKGEDEPEDRQEEPSEDATEDTGVEPERQVDEPEEVDDEECAAEPSAVLEHEPEQLEVEEECPPAVADNKTVETQADTEETEAAESKPEKKDPEKREITSRRQVQTEGQVRKDKKGPEQVDFRNVLRKTESPASAVTSTKFYRGKGSGDTDSGAKQDSNEAGRSESPETKSAIQPFQVNGAGDVDSVVEAYEARREARRKAREARRKSTDEKARDTVQKMSYREKKEQELKKQSSQSGTPQEQQSTPQRPMQRQTSSNPTKQLLQWAQHKTRFYENVNVTDFTHSFKDGLALAAIMHCYMPEWVPFEELSADDPRRNFELAFAAAKEAGIPEMLDADDFLSVTVPDAQSVMTYLVTVYQHFN